MEIKEFIQISILNVDIEVKEIKSPNNKQYEIRAEKYEEKIGQIVIQKRKAYKESEELFLY